VKTPFVSPADVAKALQEQAVALASLPQAATNLNKTLVAFAQTVGRLDTLVQRLDRLTEPLEAPLTALAPRLEMLVPLLDEEVLGSVPELFETLKKDAVPALHRIDQTQQQVALIAESVERIMGGLDETLSRLGALPGVSMIQRRASKATSRNAAAKKAASAKPAEA
jgi:ABC-type transporter Mla subunit MlaD